MAWSACWICWMKADAGWRVRSAMVLFVICWVIGDIGVRSRRQENQTEGRFLCWMGVVLSWWEPREAMLIGCTGVAMYSSDLIDISSRRRVMESSGKLALIEQLLPD
jgi:hypothetical protein